MNATVSITLPDDYTACLLLVCRCDYGVAGLYAVDKTGIVTINEATDIELGLDESTNELIITENGGRRVWYTFLA